MDLFSGKPTYEQLEARVAELEAEVARLSNKAPAALSRFSDFWKVYPNKKGKNEAEKRWNKDGLDRIADSIIGHVRLMIACDDGWQRGYAPMGSTYLNQARWTDEPQAAPIKGNGNARLTAAEQIAVNIARESGEIPSGYEGNANVMAALGGNLRQPVDFGVRAQRGDGCGRYVGQGADWIDAEPVGQRPQRLYHQR